MTVGLPLTIPNAFDRCVRWYGAEEAVVDSTLRLTYAELDVLSRRTASLFASLGAEAGRPIALLCPPSSIYMVAWLGAVRLGAIPMVLHARESGATLAAACAAIGPNLLVYDASMETLAREVAAGCPDIRASVEAVSALEPERRGSVLAEASIPADLVETLPPAILAEPREDDTAIIVLSSGTTSLPKGVIHTHRSLVENARSNLYLYQGISSRDRSLVPLSTAFIGCYNGWFPFLNAGGCTIFLERFDLAVLVERVASERATHVFLTPTLWRRVLNTAGQTDNFRSVRLIGFAAEPMDATTLQRLRDTISPNVVQMYGSTEAGAAVTCITADEMLGERLTSVGRPMPNTDLRIVVPGGGADDVVPAGNIGEVLVSSPSLAAGIWGNATATSASFVEDGPRRWWRSRDLGRLDSGGYLFLEGRHDDMIISGGINIMPARVEEALLAHPAVAECAVVGVPDAEWGEKVHAFIVATGATLAEADLERHMRDSTLSAYQRPRSYTFVTELPRNSTNKVLRRVLRDTARRNSSAQQHEPASKIEDIP